jgi:hypothetical protein
MAQAKVWLSSWSVRSVHCSRTGSGHMGPHRSRKQPSPVTTTNNGGSGNLGYPTPVSATNGPGKALTR